ncbi:hypothetical protein [Glaesserella parasuis]|uniref:hypothetical protein n=1 Tax=Glaesserella parasuis TaxID=738 RepID=UPI0009501856|nr:hypothetical protein [Glaesserella parasuis]MDG6281805.1 hypothetical protein [Glaesserella parasuis]MDG6284822.1 hypothetical protein [Glaesserella parasuis]MDG6286849.1 hypothetical protein [Glaesserella parasuis]MDG6289036.1 hypothetical protein [Glaesserella parasuis]MDG6291108.1 hypothetical protein [Glaesserella parasuis]
MRVNKNLLTEQQEQINKAIKLLEACIYGTVLGSEGEPLTQTEIIEAVIEMLKGEDRYYAEEVTNDRSN